VLQTTAIFANVGKGVMAAKEDLQVGGNLSTSRTEWNRVGGKGWK
jgi:hypothetical protein